MDDHQFQLYCDVCQSQMPKKKSSSFPNDLFKSSVLDQNLSTRVCIFRSCFLLRGKLRCFVLSIRRQQNQRYTEYRESSFLLHWVSIDNDWVWNRHLDVNKLLHIWWPRTLIPICSRLIQSHPVTQTTTTTTTRTTPTTSRFCAFSSSVLITSAYINEAHSSSRGMENFDRT